MSLLNIFNIANTYLTDILIKLNLGEDSANLVASYSLLIINIFIATLLFYLTRWILRKFILQYIRKSETTWDDYLLEHRIFHKASYLIPAFFLGWTINPIFSDLEGAKNILLLILSIYKIVIITNIFTAVLDTAVHVYNMQSESKKLPIKGFAQVVKLLFWVIAIILIISSIIDKNPTSILAGLGAVSAVLLLVFKDPILGFVGGIQLAAFDMVKEGDWISMPKYNADGTVIDISISTVKVQNWDNTISTLPTYSLISDSVKNWRGMEESEGRRIKRSVLLDTHSIKFCTPEMLERFSKFEFLDDYIFQTEERIQKSNKKIDTEKKLVLKGRRQTNLGVFRAYLINYLENHPDINTSLTTMVRQLEPTEKGIPMEIYVFSKVKSWVAYESIQSDIFDHILAIIPEFELSVFQEPSGADFRKILK
ncbi:MAG: mechanosensitive ion channel [Bacteroidales bacterium]|nr:mechanosensitive ion channel [Bacteroidales bacterium]